MLIKHFFIEKIAHSSYLIAGSHACAVVDPERDIEAYLAAAAELDVRITHIIETHLHADFVSGHMDLADATGAAIYAPKLAKCAFPHVPVREGDSFEIEHMRFDVLETPGHTPEHVSYVVTDTVRGSKPACVFTGDTLFVGDVGRPDLFPGRARELAAKLYDSLHGKLLELPDFCEVLPAHGAGSLCGRAMASKWRSTIGYEKRYNQALRIRDREAFVRSLTEDMPAAPDHFARLSAVNAKGPVLVRKLAEPRALLPGEFDERTRARRTTVVDVRSYDAYAGQHLRDSISLPLAGNFPTFAGWVLSPERRLLLVADTREQVLEATSWLRRVGVDRVDSFLEGGVFAWSRDGLPTAHTALLSPDELHDVVTGEGLFEFLDVRAPAEYASSHIDGSRNIQTADLRVRPRDLDPALPTVVMCSSGNRSSTAASFLERHGFANILNAAGGYAGYKAAGHSDACAMCALPHGPRLVEDGRD